MTEQAFFVSSPSINPYYNLALEKYLFDHVKDGQIIFYLWRNQRTVVVGLNQNIHKECNLTAMENDHCYLARRSTGGGAVYHDLGNLNYSFIAGMDIYDPIRQQKVILQALKALGFSGELSGRNDIEIANRKISGNAYLQTKQAGLHHGTLMYNVDMRMLDCYLKVADEKIKAKGVDSVRQRVANLKDFDPDLTMDQLQRGLRLAFQQEYGPAEELPINMDLDDLIEHFHSYKYLYNKNSGCTMLIHDYYDFGETQFYFDLKDNLIQKVDVFSDALDVELVLQLKELFAKLPLDDQIFAKRLAKLNRPELTKSLNTIYRKVKKQAE